MTTSMVEIDVGAIGAIPSGEGRNVQSPAGRIAVFHTRGGSVFAVQAECPHRGGPLADGLVGGTTLICPLHAWKFDLSTGEALFGSCGIRTFPARIDERGHILLSIDQV
jgi:nitrite reductase (NADH) small subunit